MPHAKNTKGADAMAGWNLKGGDLVPEQPTAGADMSSIPRQATTGGPAAGAAQPTHAILVMVTRDDHQKLPTFGQQGKIYTHTPTQMTPEPVAVSTHSKEPAHPAGPTPPGPGPIPAATQGAIFGPAPVLPQINGPEPAEALPHGKYCKNKNTELVSRKLSVCWFQRLTLMRQFTENIKKESQSSRDTAWWGLSALIIGLGWHNRSWNRGFLFLYVVYIWRISLYLHKDWVLVWGSFLLESPIKNKIDKHFVLFERV